MVYTGDVGIGLCAPIPDGGLTSAALTQSDGLVESLAKKIVCFVKFIEVMGEICSLLIMTQARSPRTPR